MAVKDRNTLVLYSTATCNLCCNYCFIDKNPALKKIDKVLDESFKGDYYFEYAKRVFPDKNQLKEVQVWGGEPWLRMDRAYQVIRNIFEYYPNCNMFMASTNFVNAQFINQFDGLVKIFQNIDKNIHIKLQISLDGPKEYTDAGRGIGVTDQFIARFDEFMEYLNKGLPNNINLDIMFKATLNMNSIKMLQTYDQVLYYYSFFEEFQDKFMKLKVNGNKIKLLLPVPNTACPTPHTKEDGILFANTLKNCRQIEHDKVLRYYNSITPFGNGHGDLNIEEISYRIPGGVCNSGHGMVGLLPNNMISMCHMAFVDTLEDFKHESVKKHKRDTSLDSSFFEYDSNHPMTLKYEDIEKFERRMSFFHKQKSTARTAIIVNTIRLEAMVGNISDRFMNEKDAIRAARLLTTRTSYCIRDSLNVAGSLSSYPVGLIRLLFNGAEEYLYDF